MNVPDPPNPHQILSVGTRVVAQVEIRGTDGKPIHPRGAVGVITQSPTDYWHSYRVRFLDGFEASLKRQEIALLVHHQQPNKNILQEYDLQQCVIFRCIVGSRAYGLDHDESDTDRRGIYLPPTQLQWSLFGVPEQLEYPNTEEVYWEIQKFLIMALKANPNVLECLYTPLIEHATPLAHQLLQNKSVFLSKMVYQTYNGYVMSQFKKLQSDLRNKGAVKWKHVMHLIRLLLSGITVLNEGFVPVNAEGFRDKLLSIRRGEIPFDEVEKWRITLQHQFDEAYSKTSLPERPDYQWANQFLIQARKIALEG